MRVEGCGVVGLTAAISNCFEIWISDCRLERSLLAFSMFAVLPATLLYMLGFRVKFMQQPSQARSPFIY